jgi:hypothetical protein
VQLKKLNNWCGRAESSLSAFARRHLRLKRPSSGWKRRPVVTTMTHEGRLCGSWEETVEYYRGVVAQLSPRIQADVLFWIELHEWDFALNVEANGEPLSPEDVDVLCGRLAAAVPTPLDETLEQGEVLTFEELAKCVRVLEAELLDLRDRVTTLEAAAGKEATA